MAHASLPDPPADLLVVFAGAHFRKEFGIHSWRDGAARAIALGVARFEWRRVPLLGLPGDGGLLALVDATPAPKRLFVLLVEGDRVAARLAKKGPWGTWSEAKAFARIARERGATSLLVCTSDFHLARAVQATRRALAAEGHGPHCAVVGFPVPEPAGSRLAADRWWRSPRAWVSLTREGFKRIVYGVGLPMAMDPAIPRARGRATRPSHRDS